MAERLDVVKLAPAAILDAGCGTGEALAELARPLSGRAPGRARRRAADAVRRTRRRAGAAALRVRAALSRFTRRAPVRRAALRLRRHRARCRSRRARSTSSGATSRCSGCPTCRARSPNSTACWRVGGLVIVHDVRAGHAEGAARRVRGRRSRTRTSGRFVDMHDIGDLLVARRLRRPGDAHGTHDADLRRRAGDAARPEGDRRDQRGAGPAARADGPPPLARARSPRSKRRAATGASRRRSR